MKLHKATMKTIVDKVVISEIHREELIKYLRELEFVCKNNELHLGENLSVEEEILNLKSEI